MRNYTRFTPFVPIRRRSSKTFSLQVWEIIVANVARVNLMRWTIARMQAVFGFTISPCNLGRAVLISIREKILNQFVAISFQGLLSHCNRNWLTIYCDIVILFSQISWDFITLLSLWCSPTINLLSACLILNSLSCLLIFILLTMVPLPVRIRLSIILKALDVVIVISFCFFL